MNGFTDKEEQIMNKLVEIVHLFSELPVQHQSDDLDFTTSIHNLQKIIGMRILRRELPDTFITE